MLTNVRSKILLLAVSVGLIQVVSCTQDEKKPEEVVAPANADNPGTPEATPASNISSKAIYFAFDDYTLNADAQSSLNGFADQLKASAGSVVQVEGHCDERGTAEYNIALGNKRAQAVKDYLVRLGIEDARLSTVSYGEEKPVADGHDESAWSKNRRAELVVSSR